MSMFVELEPALGKDDLGQAVAGFVRSETAPTDLISAHFSVAEIACRCGKCEDQMLDLRLPVKLEDLRAKMGYPLRVSSGYRCRAHNKRIGGKSHSQHLFGKAVDISVETLNEAHVIALAAVEFGFRGFGIYSSFVHLDIRAFDDFETFALWGRDARKGFRNDIAEIITDRRWIA